MFKLLVNKTEIFKNEGSIVTSGAKDAFKVQFEFSNDWNGFVKTVCFSNDFTNETVYSLILPDDGECVIPWELFKNSEKEIYIGIYGVKGDVVLPTIWYNLCTVENGAEVGEESQEATPTAYEQMLSIAQKLEKDADEGRFNGYTPVKGEDYFTQQEIDDIKSSIKQVLFQEYGNIEEALDKIIEIQNTLINS